MRRNDQILFLTLFALIGIANSCESSDDCRPDWEVCNEKSKTCVHKAAFPSLMLEWWGYWLTILVLTVTNSGGNGGGGALIPVLVVFFQFN